MDPYLEAPHLWSDFHTTFLVALRKEIAERLPDRYTAHVERHVWIHEPDAAERSRRVRPDVIVSERKESSVTTTTVSTIAAPLTVLLPASRHEGQVFLTIVDVHDNKVVTVVELLSLSNKQPGPERETYLTKRLDYLASGTNLVEIDLLRSGLPMPVEAGSENNADYSVLVCRATDLPQAGKWEFSVRDPLPRIPIPLLAADGDIAVELRKCLERTYDEAQYHREIDYTQPPPTPLRESVVAWARELLSANR
jgi:hypothetical protein